MQTIQWLLYGLALVLLLSAVYMLVKKDVRRMVHLLADASLFAYAGYVGAARGPVNDSIIISGASVVVLLMLVSGYLYNQNGQKSNARLSWIAGGAIALAVLAYYMGFLG